MAGSKSVLRKVKLSECATFQEGYVNPSQTVASYFGSDVKWLRAVDLNDSFVTETSRKLSIEGYQSAGKAAQLFAPETLAISKSGTIGRLGILKDYMCGNRAVINIRVNLDEYDSRFIFYSLLSRRNLIEELAAGSVQRNLYCSVLGDLEIEVPPLPEQKAIASILGALDDKIELNRRMNATLESMARALFQSWFVDFDPVRAKLDGRQPAGLDPATAALFPASFQDSPLGPIPLGWRTTSIAEIAKRISMGPFGSRITRDNFVPDGVPVIRGGNLTDGFVDDDFVYLTESKANELRSAVAHPLDIVFTHRGTLGQVGIIPLEARYDRYIVSQSQMMLSVDQDRIDPWFIYEYFKSPVGEQALLANTSTTGVPAIGRPTTTLKAIQFVAPPTSLARHFAEVANSFFSQHERNTQQSRGLARIRDTLLPNLLSSPNMASLF